MEQRSTRVKWRVSRGRAETRIYPREYFREPPVRLFCQFNTNSDKGGRMQTLSRFPLPFPPPRSFSPQLKADSANVGGNFPIAPPVADRSAVVADCRKSSRPLSTRNAPHPLPSSSRQFLRSRNCYEDVARNTRRDETLREASRPLAEALMYREPEESEVLTLAWHRRYRRRRRRHRRRG